MKTNLCLTTPLRHSRQPEARWTVVITYNKFVALFIFVHYLFASLLSKYGWWCGGWRQGAQWVDVRIVRPQLGTGETGGCIAELGSVGYLHSTLYTCTAGGLVFTHQQLTSHTRDWPLASVTSLRQPLIDQQIKSNQM